MSALREDVDRSVRRRTGGRSAAVRSAVLGAALAALEEGSTALSLPDLAARAGVAPSSLYRRWGSWEAVVVDALLASSEAAVPVPDTGTLRGDLLAYVGTVAGHLASPRGRALARAAVSSGHHAGAHEVRRRFWTTRFELARVMFDRARERGELPASGADDLLLLELLVAPLHFRALVTGDDARAALAERVDLVLAAAGAGR
ncbi:TetR-like C-terminal domain-containing protein [Nocardioides sp.]|uniref:TetR-like C-terminal domain-containing protein n=1 Tax=Nocardioides sp. TaxID=35761 RepID=UPI00351128ED